MLSEDKYFYTLTEDQLWQRYCGFLDLSVGEFMDIQKELLMDEIERVADSLLGKKIMNNQKPKSVEEFRRTVPLTTYDDYEPYLSDRQEDALAEKPYLWCHSAGRGGYFKWIPHSSEIVDKAVRSYIAGFIIASCSRKGQVNIGPGVRVFTILAPPPYTSGAIVGTLFQRFSARVMPRLEDVEPTDFQERLKTGFQMALKDGIDVVGAIASVLVRMGEQLSGEGRGKKFSASMLHPRILVRLLRAWLWSKREKRAILPKDIWQLKGIMVSGLDTAIYKDDVAHYWGSTPYELYAGTEALTYAMQAWNKKGMIFLPDMVFLEFVPYEEVLRLQEDETYRPSTVLLSQVEEGQLYEVVITHFHGMPLLRYRLNDVVKVIAKKDESAGIHLPQIAFQRRVGEVINLAGLAQLDEKTLWHAIANTGVKYADWAACKEYDQNQSFLRLYLELKEERDATEVETMIDSQLKTIDTDYKDLDFYLSLQPVRVTFLSPGTFDRYMEEKIKQGASIGHFKPARVNPPQAVVQRLLELSQVGSRK